VIGWHYEYPQNHDKVADMMKEMHGDGEIVRLVKNDKKDKGEGQRS
jgi:hypothetical protein